MNILPIMLSELPIWFGPALVVWVSLLVVFVAMEIDDFTQRRRRRKQHLARNASLTILTTDGMRELPHPSNERSFGNS